MKSKNNFICQNKTIYIVWKKWLSVLLIYFIAFLTHSSLFAQGSRDVKGKVLDIQGNPIIGATVYLKGTDSKDT